jgi:transcriptional regulator GlxA family with amidase domain
MAEWLHEDTRSHTSLTPDLTKSLFRAMLAQVVESWMVKDDGFQGRIRAYVREHIAEDIGLNDLACKAGMSKYHFARKYKELTGRTPMEDVRMLRLEYARNLVLSTSMPLKVIAEKAGMGDQYHMSRLFRRRLDASPGRLRLNLKQ